MAAQQGFQYEKNAAKALKPLNFVPKSFEPAGAGSDRPDLEIVVGKSAPIGCELKITDASAGSLVIKYNPKTKKWAFGDISADDKEKIFIADLAEQVGLFDYIKAKWKKTPLKVDKEFITPQMKDMLSSIPKRKQYETDLANFPDLRGEISAANIEKYYISKKTYYVNVGTHGFYLMGTKNPLGFIDVPRFAASATAGWRARVQYKGSDNYQFTFEMNFKMRAKSKYNIAPCSKTNVNILTDKIILPAIAKTDKKK